MFTSFDKQLLTTKLVMKLIIKRGGNNMIATVLNLLLVGTKTFLIGMLLGLLYASYITIKYYLEKL